MGAELRLTKRNKDGQPQRWRFVKKLRTFQREIPQFEFYKI